jgi:RNA polymerase sigma-70 factor (ECF subfamily)
VLAGSHRVWAVRADLNRRAGRTAAALADYDRALELAGNQAERRYLAQARREAAEAFVDGTLPAGNPDQKKG